MSSPSEPLSAAPPQDARRRGERATPTQARALRRARDVVRNAVRDHALWRPGDHVLLACSGGRDSIAALALLAALRPSLGHRLSVATIDHGLRDDAHEVTAAVAAAAMRYDVRAHSRAVAVGAGPQLEARARALRYGALEDLATELGAEVIATAHHADDQAETLLMRLCRGAGAEALDGIRRRRDDGIVRPMLDLDRAALAAVCDAEALRWVDDPSNDALDATRNHLRHRALPALDAATPGAARGLVRSMRTLADAGLAADHYAGALLDLACVETEGALRLPLALLPAEADLLAPLLRAVALRLGVAPPGQRAVAELARARRRGPPAQIEITCMHVYLAERSALFRARHVA